MAKKLANNSDIDMLNLLNEAFAANGHKTYTNAVDAYFAALELSIRVKDDILTAFKNKAAGLGTQADIDAIYSQYEWLATVQREIAARNGHDTSIPKAVSFFQQDGNLWVPKGSVGRGNRASQGDGGAACCNAEIVDAWIVQELDALMTENPSASQAEIEKAFIDAYCDYAALQDKSKWEKAFARAIVTDMDGFLNLTDGLNYNGFSLEWCMGGETLGMNEEFVLTHGEISEEEKARLEKEGKCTVEVKDSSGNVVGTYELTYNYGLKGVLKEMYHSGRITDEAQLQTIKKYYESLYHESI